MYGVDHIVNIEAETINLENGQIIRSKIDPKLIYSQHTDKNKDAIILAFPDIKPGSVIEYQYRLVRDLASNFPAWYFQSDAPTRYSEFNVFFNARLQFNAFTRKIQPFSKDNSFCRGHVWAASEPLHQVRKAICGLKVMLFKVFHCC